MQDELAGQIMLLATLPYWRAASYRDITGAADSDEASENAIAELNTFRRWCWPDSPLLSPLNEVIECHLLSCIWLSRRL